MARSSRPSEAGHCPFSKSACQAASVASGRRLCQVSPLYKQFPGVAGGQEHPLGGLVYRGLPPAGGIPLRPCRRLACAEPLYIPPPKCNWDAPTGRQFPLQSAVPPPVDAAGQRGGWDRWPPELGGRQGSPIGLPRSHRALRSSASLPNKRVSTAPRERARATPPAAKRSAPAIAQGRGSSSTRSSPGGEGQAGARPFVQDRRLSPLDVVAGKDAH